MKYAFYIYASYGVTALILLGLVVFSLRDYRQQKKQLEREDAGEEGEDVRS